MALYLSRHEKKKSLASRTRHYVDLQVFTDVSDGQGGHTEDWSTVTDGANIPAEILPIHAVRQAKMRSYNVNATHYIHIRSNIPVPEVGRVKWDAPGGTQYFHIHSVEDVQTRDVVQLLITEQRRP
jgi:head-tail adaptor